MKTIQQEWESFAKAVFRGMDVSETQSDEMRKAFFAGATAMLAMVQETGDLSEEEGVAHLDALHDELLAFMQSLVEAEGL